MTIVGPIGDDKIWESEEMKLLRVTIDNKLKFDNHIALLHSQSKTKCVK